MFTCRVSREDTQQTARNLRGRGEAGWAGPVCGRLNIQVRYGLIRCCCYTSWSWTTTPWTVGCLLWGPPSNVSPPPLSLADTRVTPSTKIIGSLQFLVSSAMNDSLWYLMMIALLVLSYILTHLLVVWLQRKRLMRIESKSLQLCGGVCADGDESDLEPSLRKPITLITGFLGSGKTTLVNRILTSSDHGLRVLVIENELGAVSIDHALIDDVRQQHMPDDVVVLKNGCMCCSGEMPGSELERVLDKLLEMSKLDERGMSGEAHSGGSGGLPFDHVLIETTGLADPSPIVQVLCRREMERSPFYLDAVVAVVDAQNILRHLQPSGAYGFARRRAEAEKQIALADKIVLNKVDLLDGSSEGQEDEGNAFVGADGASAASSDAAAAKDAVLAAVRAVNAGAGLTWACRADVPLGELLGLRAFSSAGWLEHHRRHLDNAAKAEAIAPSSAAHTESVACVSLTLDAPSALSLPRLQAWLQRLVAARHEDLFRVKGVLHIAGHDERFVLHGIHANVRAAFERRWAPDEARSSAMVVIGYGLDQGELEAGFRAAAAHVGRADGDDSREPCERTAMAAQKASGGGAELRRRHTSEAGSCCHTPGHCAGRAPGPGTGENE